MKRDPGNTLKKAQKINVSDDSFSFKNKISAQDRNDLFRFRLRSSHDLDLNISGLQKNADLELYTLKKKRGKVLKNIGKIEFNGLRKKDIRQNLRRVGRSQNGGKNDERIGQRLEPGQYYIRVFDKKRVRTKYTLRFSISELSTPTPTPTSTPTPISTPTPTPIPTPTPGDPQLQQRWIRQFGTPQDDQGLGITSDSTDQNIYISGATGGELLSTTTDAFIQKYSSDGTQQWFQTFGSSDGDVIESIAIDTANNIYGVGATDIVPPEGLSIGESNAYFVKYTKDGTALFEQRFDEGNLESGSDVALDNTNIYTVGRIFTLNVANLLSPLTISPFANQYNTSGQLQTQLNLNLGSQGYGSRVLIDDQNNMYVAGVNNATVSITDLNNPFTGDVFITKYNASGQQLWSETLSSSSADFVTGIALDHLGNVYITGDTQGAFPDNTNSGETDFYLAKFSANGDRLWVTQYGTAGTDKSAGIAIDSKGSIYLAGETSGSLFDNVSLGETDGWLGQFDADGNLVESTLIGTAQLDRVNRITLDSAGHLYVTGDTGGSLGGTHQGGLDVWIAQYSVG